MPADWDLPELQQLWSDEEENSSSGCQEIKRDCDRCSRPKSVCLCPWLPETPLQTEGQLIILQHPHELKKRLATVPVLQQCLADVAVLRSRYYQPGKPQHAALRQALEGAAAGRYPLLLMFPGSTARDVQEVAAELQLHGDGGNSSGSNSSGGSCGSREGGSNGDRQRDQQQNAEPPFRPPPPQPQQADQQQAASSAPPLAAGREEEREPRYVLLVIDGTWKQAKEMFKGLRQHVLQPAGPGIRVQLPPLKGAPEVGSCQQESWPAAALAAAPNAEQPSDGAAVQGEAAVAQADVAGSSAAAGARIRQQAAPQHEAEQAAPVPDKPLLLRMEPLKGCLSTCEAVARALGALEPQGSAVQNAVLRPLAQLVQFQAQWNPSLVERLQTGSGYSQARRRMGLSMLNDLTAIP